MPIFRRWLTDRDGAAAVEAALVMPLLLLLMAGLIDGSRAIVQSMQVNAAAQAGADYARLHGWNAAGIRAAASGATSLAVSVSAPQLVKACATASSGVQTQAAGSCPGGGAPGDFVRITAQAPFTVMMPWPGVPHAPTLRSDAVVRVQ